MARQKAPAYQRYPKQIMGDDKVLLMDWDCYGMHNWLLDISWQQDPRGTIPDDTAVLRRWLRNPDEETWRRVWPQLKTAWPILEGGRRGNTGMIETAKKQENYSNGNRGKEKYANGAQIGTQNVTGLGRKSVEDEDESEVKPEEILKKALEEERFVLPVWMPEVAWLAYLQMRHKKRADPTENAKRLICKKLEKWMNQGQSVEEILYQSVTSNWTDVYELKESYGTGQNNSRGRQSAGQARTERTRSVLTEALRERHGDSAVAGPDLPTDADGDNQRGTGPVLVRGAQGPTNSGD